MKLSELMSRKLATVTAQTTAAAAAKAMEAHDIGSVPVCEGNQIVGILTDRDIVIRALAAGKDPAKVTVGEIMSRELVLGHPEMDVHAAAQLMADEQIRRLPVVDNGGLVGIVALGDLAVEDKFENEAGSALSEISQPADAAH